MFPPTFLVYMCSFWLLNTTTTWQRVCVRSIWIKKEFYYNNMMTKYLWGQLNSKGTILITLANQVFCKKLMWKASQSYADNWWPRILLPDKKMLVNENLPIFVSRQREKILGQTLVNSTDNLDFLKTWRTLKKIYMVLAN